MIKRVTCSKCGSVLEYDNRSIHEGNRDFEEFDCPICGYMIDTVFTDLLPNIRVISKNENWDK